uniref:Protein kinase domain-containing protein n=1 Tax=Panagrellus redivivus TaxID=6233 RepID=A0A7E4ZXE2_PANRE
MATTGPPKLSAGTKVKEQFTVVKKLGEGACGAVYLVQNTKNPKIIAAMKIEAIQKSKDDEILKMEVFVLKKLQKSRHVCRLLMAGRTPNYSFVVMSLLGKELGELRRKMPERKMSLSTVLRVAVQCVEGIQDMHGIGFIHRDIKPSNFSCGAARRDVIYLFDFGLARQIVIFDKDGKNPRLREPRIKVSFRGTVRYCSVNVHLYKEQGRHDDIISMLFMLVELLVRALPWKGMARKDSGHIKETVTDAVLFKGCPPSFTEVFGILKKLTYHDVPPYHKIIDIFMKDIKENKIKMSDPYDWMKKGFDPPAEGARAKKADEQAEIEKMEDTNTLRDVDDDSIDTDASEDFTETRGFAKEDTLDNVAEM